MSKQKDRPILEVVLESGEVVADLVAEDQVLSSIPIIGSAIKICKAADAIRDRLFLAKLASFLSELDKVSPEAKQQIKEKVAESPAEAQEVGEAVLLAIERVTDLNKPQVLAFIFLAYVDSVITSIELRRLVLAIDIAFSEDLLKLLEASSLPGRSVDTWLEYLVPSGLARQVSSQTSADFGDDFGKRYFEPTLLANKLRNAYFHGKKAANA